MKKLAAILLTCLLLFNWYGYQFVLDYLKATADKELNARLDVNDYDEAALIEISIDLKMPYQTQSTQFERSYGEIEQHGIVYTYVKRKVQDGFLILQCIPNIQKQKVADAGKVAFRINNDFGQEQHGKNNSPLIKIFKSDFNQQLISCCLLHPVNDDQNKFPSSYFSMSKGYFSAAYRPPKV